METLLARTAVFGSVTQRRDATFHLLACKMHREFAVADSATPLALEGLTFELLAAGSRATKQPARGNGIPAPWLCRVRELPHERFTSRDLRIADLRALVDVHPVYLTRAFRNHFGLTPAEYLRQLRLTWSATARAESASSIAEIAAEAGFTDQSHFTRVFRRAFGETPGGFGRSMGVSRPVIAATARPAP
jgi:AraC family transcriptional regulator